MKNSKKKKKRLALFEPVSIATILSRQLNRDLLHENPIDPQSMQKNYDLQKTGGLKKFCMPKVPGSYNVPDRKALETFRATNGHIGTYNDTFVRPKQLSKYAFGECLDVDRVLNRMKSIVQELLHDITLEEVFIHCKHSNGTTVGTEFGNTNLSVKCTLPLTATLEQAKLFNVYLIWDRTFRDVLQRENPEATIGLDLFSIYDIVTTSETACVPKNDETSRVIMKETTVGMYLQQGVGRAITERLKRIGIDISTQQDIHRTAALIESVLLNRATIDLKSASDTVGLKVVDFLLSPLYVCELIMKIRSTHTLIPNKEFKSSSDNRMIMEKLPLNMVSSMGNAFTFPLETLIFYSAALAVRSTNLTPNTRSAFTEVEAFDYGITVFGDDCILPSEDVPLFIETLEKLGFIINSEKSFWTRESKFRESCGMDAYSFRNVRPFQIKGPRNMKPSTLRAWLYTLWNRTINKLISSNGSLTYVYSNSLAYLAHVISISNKEIFIVPDSFPDDSGCKMFGDFDRLKRLFQKKGTFASMKLDEHGTIYFRFLLSNTEDAYRKTSCFYYWNSLKVIERSYTVFPRSQVELWSRHRRTANVCQLFPEPPVNVIDNDFEIESNGMGYVVSSSTDCAGFSEQFRYKKTGRYQPR